ncbi:hypothetical protein LguiB_006181 [Lonicera macranthoides]
MLLQNLTQLRQLSLSRVDISSVIFPVNMSSSLTLLDLSCTGLHGNLLNEVLHLPNLQKLMLSGNRDLTIYLPKAANVRSSSPLRWLDLSDCNFFGILPQWLENLTNVTHLSLSGINFSGGLVLDHLVKLRHLRHLDLSSNNLNGHIPSSIGNLNQLVHIDLSSNSLIGAIPSSIGNLTQLVTLFLFSNSLTGPIPSTIGKLTQLVKLFLLSNSLTGAIPSSIGNLSQLEYLLLAPNSLTGPIPSSIGNLTPLVVLGLSLNSLTGSIPSSIGNLTHLLHLELSPNSLTGPIPSSIGNLTPLKKLQLSSMSLTGPIPSSIGNLTHLVKLDLSNNSLTGPIPSSIGNLSQLLHLILSSNSLNGPIPHSIIKLKLLLDLQLSRNSLIGIVELSMFSNLPNLSTLDLSYNNLSVRTTNIDNNVTFRYLDELRLSSCKVKEFQHLLRYIKNIFALDLRQNILQGPLPSIICNCIFLKVLDLSHNNLSGAILPCLGNFSGTLSVLNLKANNFHGTIPTTFAQGNHFANLNFNSNQLEGKLPRSLANCKQLEVLDLGNNHLNDTFPAWLETLPKLKVLVLKSNRFHGSIPNNAHAFSKLQIIDLSNNEFSGRLPSKYFRYFKTMMEVQGNSTMPEYMSNRHTGIYYEYSVTLVMKGTERVLDKILTAFTAIDMSNNKFEGEIPNNIGNLKSIRELNLSHNKLVGHIPLSLGKLYVLESLDLSFNQLKGEIPQQLTCLISLEFLNLSQNHLVGCIPKGKQFNTFENDSYSGNSALRGFPLSKDCGGEEMPHQRSPTNLRQDDDSDFGSGFTWKAVCLGYGCGIILGLVIGYLVFLTRKPKWLTGLVEEYQYKNGMKRGHKRCARRRN